MFELGEACRSGWSRHRKWSEHRLVSHFMLVLQGWAGSLRQDFGHSSYGRLSRAGMARVSSQEGMSQVEASRALQRPKLGCLMISCPMAGYSEIVNSEFRSCATRDYAIRVTTYITVDINSSTQGMYVKLLHPKMRTLSNTRMTGYTTAYCP